MTKKTKNRTVKDKDGTKKRKNRTGNDLLVGKDGRAGRELIKKD